MLIVVLGGARSGKSALAERLGRQHDGDVVFIATCPRIDGDEELATRIARHRAERPQHWTTIEEELDLDGALDAAGAAMVIVDCLTTWLGNVSYHGWQPDRILETSGTVCGRAAARAAPTVVISNEVGLGIVPADADSRAYRDLLGRINTSWVAAADRALLMVAGRALALHDPGGLL
jgi:adenosyl cobinamide kinase/adenosyl cobinamide phosphate guanylyltransferase